MGKTYNLFYDLAEWELFSIFHLRIFNLFYLMIKYLLTFLLIAFSILHAQASDSLFNSADSPKKDSTGVIAAMDSLTTYDSLGVETMKPDTLIPLQVRPLNENSEIISKKTFLFYNYRYAGDFLRSFSLNFIRDFAFIGYPNETLVYGAGNTGVSFLEDGVLWNNRYSNSLDLNNIQSEDIDSVEVIRSPRGFLYGPYNNPVSVNFIMKDFLSPVPYSRIKYYEGPDGEAMIDGKFNAQIYKRWNLSFEVTNRGADSSYRNSEYSLWQANVKLKYFLSNSVNLTAFYGFVKSSLGLNGGVDVDSIRNITSNVDSLLYDRVSAPVIFPNQTLNVLNHNIGLRLQALPYDDTNVELSLYYKYSQDETNNPHDSLLEKYSIEVKTLGANLNIIHNFGFLSAKVISNLEKNELTNSFKSYDELIDIIDYNYFSGAGILSLHLLDSTLVPSVFYKYYKQNYNQSGKDYSNSNSGFGVDVLFNPVENISFYAGYSVYSQFDNPDEKNFEIGANLKANNFCVDIKYFDRKNFVFYSAMIPHWIWSRTGIEIGLPPKGIKGIGVKLNYKFWKLLIETNTSHYFDMYEYNTYTLPDVQFTGGIYLNDWFFEDNLLLKSGFIFYYTGKHIANITTNVDPSNKLDFSLAGEIKKVAIVYFLWENLFNNQYYVTPYYPMPERSIRFGVAWELFN